MKYDSNPFKQKLYDEFEQNSFKILGVPADRVREVLGARDENIDEMIESAWEFGGAQFARTTFNMVLATLNLVYHETEIGRELTDDEKIARYESFDVGLTKEIMDGWTDQRVRQLESVAHFESVDNGA